jgi:ATP-binding cassette subfamily F protein 3
MTLLAAEQICKKFNDQVILDRVSFTIQGGDRIALVGKNGIGKTTLLEMLAGKQQVDSGVISRSRSCVIDYVEQEKGRYLEMTLFEFVADSRPELPAMDRQISELEAYLEVHPGDATQLNRLGTLQQQYEQQDGFNFENEIAVILTGLGFSRERYDERVGNFSGGEKNRAGLARLLAGKGSLLLLDEPTNHLDIDSTVWLEEYLGKLDKACVVVSHDRAFLSATSVKIWELSYGKIDMYTSGIDKYLSERESRRRLARHRYRHQQEEIKRIEDFVRRHMAGQKTKQAQSKLKYLNRIKRLPAPRSDASGPSIRLRSSGRSHALVLSMENVALGYGSEAVLEDVSLEVYRGDRIGLVGRNGSGKSTLLRTLIGELAPINGQIRLGNNVDVAYFDQGLSDLNDEASVLDNIWEVDASADAGRLRSFLARFGFTGEDVFKVVAALSGGEKTKLCLARLLYYPANLVILDEPTNHLDIYAREALESALREYEGSYLIVSHDRFLLNNVADRIVHLDRGRASVFNGTFADFQEKTTATRAAVASKPKTGQQKEQFLAFKERSKRRARLKKKIQSTRDKIATLEQELGRLVEQLDFEVPADDWEQLQALTARRKKLEEEILKLYVAVERLETTGFD